MSSDENEAKRKQRHRYIRYLADVHGVTVRDLHREFNAACKAAGRRGVHFSVFYRVCQGLRTSARVRGWIARYFRIEPEVLWS